MKYLLAILLCQVLIQQAVAESDDLTNLKRSGKLFTVTVVPGDKHTMVHVIGNKTVDLQWDKTGLNAYLILGKKVTPLKVTKSEENFVITEDMPRPSELKLEVSSQGKKESINVPLN
jgi:hypothetical protein